MMSRCNMKCSRAVYGRDLNLFYTMLRILGVLHTVSFLFYFNFHPIDTCVQQMALLRDKRYK